VVPRPNSFSGHVCNTYEDASGSLIIDLAISTQNVFWWREKSCSAKALNSRAPTTASQWPKRTKAFTCLLDPSLGIDFPFITQAMGGFPPYNSLCAMNLSTNKLEVYFPNPRYLVQECVFILRKGSVEEADGYVIVLLNNYQEMISKLAVLGTGNFGKEVALVKLPMKLRAGLHGNWVDAGNVDGHPAPAAVINGHRWSLEGAHI
jgi:Retinal pigment epithelial membrane protein